jgi:hypothetical protein
VRVRTRQAFLVQDARAVRDHLEERQRQRLLRRRREGTARTPGDVELALAREGGAEEKAEGLRVGKAWIDWRKPTMLGQPSFKARSTQPFPSPTPSSLAGLLAAALSCSRLSPFPHAPLPAQAPALAPHGIVRPYKFPRRCW